MKNESVFLAVSLLFFLALLSFGFRWGNRLQNFLSFGFDPQVAEKIGNFSVEVGAEENREGFIFAHTYSRHPFNFSNEILVSKGEAQGVRQGQAVLFGDALIGTVKESFESSALVGTIFDGEFQLAVRIGKKGVNALLRGGARPTLTLIPKDAVVAEGEAVYTASPDLPYGIPIGETEEIRISSDDLFYEAGLRAPYRPQDILSVHIEDQSFVQ